MEGFKLATPLREKIEETLGKPIRYPSDCEHLAAHIADITGETVGVTTIKRLFGFIDDVKTPRLSTLDIISRYAGYENYDRMRLSLIGDGDSEFDRKGEIDIHLLKAGDKIRFEYVPDRIVRIRYVGEMTFEVEEAFGSSLKKGDILLIRGFALGEPLKIDNVERDGKSLGRYTAGKVAGLTGLEKVE